MRENPFSLQGRTALVTGASSGLGRHFASVLSKAGANVVLAARRLDRLQSLAAQIEAEGGKALAVTLDVTDPASVKTAFDAAGALGPVTILVNNAGVPSGSFFTKTSEEEWRAVLAVNLDGVFRVGQEAARRMVANGAGGSIINIASILGFGVSKTLSAYAASKAAVVSLTKSMALELARDKIRVMPWRRVTSPPRSTTHSWPARPASACWPACRCGGRARWRNWMGRCCCWRRTPAAS